MPSFSRICRRGWLPLGQVGDHDSSPEVLDAFVDAGEERVGGLGGQHAVGSRDGEATVFVLKGSVWLKAGGNSWQGKAGDLLIVPEGLHSLEAEEDSAVLFTVVKTDRLVQLPA